MNPTPEHTPATTKDALNADRQLAQQAAAGDARARKQVSLLAEPLINYQTQQFCKRFCKEQRYLYRCSPPKPWGNPPADAALCEWGNASFGWMLDDLTHDKRLLRFKGEQASGLKGYLFAIANSHAFYERWKDWRFGRRIHVPTYIQALAPEAAKVFFALQAGTEMALIAQQIEKSEHETQVLAQAILIELTQRNRLHLLDTPRTVSLTGLGGSDDDADEGHQLQADIPSHDPGAEELESREQLAGAWQQLSAVEQFVLEAMVIEQQDARDVLAGLQRLNISIVEGVAPEQIDRQQLYYFRRKTLSKLKKLMGDT